MQAENPFRRIISVVLVAAAGVGGVVGWLAFRADDSDPTPPRRTERTAKVERDAKPRDPMAKVDHTEWVPTVHADRGFVGSDACMDCHTENHSSWHNSYHRTMTQIASEESVIPEFEGVKLSSRGRTWELMRRGDEFWARMADPDWEMAQQRAGADLMKITDPPMVERQVVMTTGSHSFQTYWVAGVPPRLLVNFPWFYSIADGQWIPFEDSLLQPDRGRQFSHWNSVCIRCHALGGIPAINQNMPFVDTKVAEFGISCEACHGPAQEHVSLQTAARESGQPIGRDDDPIVNPARLSAKLASHVCAQCHSKDIPDNDRTVFHLAGVQYRAGDDLEDHRNILRPEDATGNFLKDHFWNDGACRVGGDEFNGLIDSPCFLNGTGKSQMSCISCHSMHHSDPTNQLADRMDSNFGCTQCHDEPQYKDQIETHTHHPADSAGSECYNCHMPRSSFALLKGIRSHRVDSPVVYSTSQSDNRPNACNLCHLDQTLEWSAEHLTDWYDAPAVELTEDDRSIAASLLWVLKGDAAQRVVVGWHMGWEVAHEASGNDWQAPFVGQLLQDSYGAIRLVAGTAVKSLPGFEDFEYSAVDDTLDRPGAVADVVARWKSAAAFEASSTKLIDENGELDVTTLNRLLSERDNKDVFINE